MWYFVVFQPSKCKKTHFQPQIWSIWPIFPKDSESLPKFCYIKRKNSEILSKLRNSELVGGSDGEGQSGTISCFWNESLTGQHGKFMGPRFKKHSVLYFPEGREHPPSLTLPPMSSSSLFATYRLSPPTLSTPSTPLLAQWWLQDEEKTYVLK